MAERLPHEVLKDIEEIVVELRALGAEYGTARKQLVVAEIAYERAFASQVLAIHHMAKSSGERVPAEDIRKAMAHSAMEVDVWSRYLSMKATVDSMERVFRIHERALSALQSELGMLKAELTMPDVRG